MKTWLITGASTGLGRGIAEAVLQAGDQAVVTSRKASRVADFEDRYPDRALACSLEVTDPRQRREVVSKALERFGKIDVLVNNAGRGHFGSVESSSEQDIRDLFEINFFGQVGMIRQVLPAMREAGSGLIINVSSMGVMFENSTGNSYYVASKLALEGVSEVLANEVKPLGIDAMIVEPGAFRTEFRVAATGDLEHENPAYAKTAKASREFLREHPHDQPGDPAKAGQAIYQASQLADLPKVLILGKGMIELAQKKLADRSAEIAKWQQLAESTDF
ncbi:short-chain dehydrogenase/reductase [Lactobacillus nasalidis]|uniref:Short-chain dehydrogenase/reductase n=1 Tax=Lactobacillus nasalidis TaxID=2797258 RepID=A0ABQ3W3B6_9LACO|nr:oxidoreductase [Lactobacillus nasalidis]GHV97462.1 short-chain dehydrogenase/reductase [Lactobacillus nasalidis]GHV99513.1 short-chain dehydrogenase/reductase [Lactobacillus nasalidis]GHW00328.1 short-chain dehydrogenase/reductase [Lactobacillus nasalidis]